MERIEGTIENFLFRSEGNGFVVARLLQAGGRHCTVLGTMPGVEPGESLRAEGEWEHNPRFGRQFRIHSYETVQPATEEGIRRYLGSGMIRGIGPALANRLVDYFGTETLRVIEVEPERLREVPGLGEKRVAWILTAWEEQRHIRDIMLFLRSHNLPAHLAAKLYAQYGERAMAVLREDPYRLVAEVRGVGFLTADMLARELGVPADAPARLRAGIQHVLEESTHAGNVFLPESLLIRRAAHLMKVDAELVRREAKALQEHKGIVVQPLPAGVMESVEEDRAVYIPSLYYCEVGLAARLQRRPALAPAAPTAPAQKRDWNALFAELELLDGIELNAAQREAVQTALTSPITVLTGGPGTGKTTTVRALLRLLTALGRRAALAAPTGRAAKRLSQVAGFEATTIHRLLEYSPEGRFQRDERHPLPADMLIVDEASMLDLPLTYYLVKALLPTTQLLLVGDVDQLPSVGPGDVLKDLIGWGEIRVVRLTEIFRQAEGSWIVRNAHRINQGHMPLFPEDAADFFLFPAREAERAAELVVDIVQNRIPRKFGLDPRRDVQVLCPMYRGAAGVANLNVRLQEALNPPSPRKAERSFAGQLMRAGDKVMQTRNNYTKEVFNGDIGSIQDIDLENQTVLVEMDDRLVPYAFREMDELTLAYAISVHKSQGNEYPAVVIPLLGEHFVLLQRNLLYTAVTRARRLVVLVGEKRAISMAVDNAAPRSRYSLLGARLRGEIQSLPDGGEMKIDFQPFLF